MAYDRCENCGEGLPNPTLEDAIVGRIECIECEQWGKDLDHKERRIAIQIHMDDIADALYKLKRALTGLD